VNPLHDRVRLNFKSVENRNIPGILKMFTEDALFIDPHSPNPTKRGHAETEDGLRWAMGGMRSFSFTPRRFFDASDGQGAVAVEVDTHHVLKTGMHLRFSQLFVFEERDGQFTRLQAYEPYGPNGVGALVLGVTRVLRRLRRAPARTA
jgi:ketosteroid isomerase-like protein